MNRRRMLLGLGALVGVTAAEILLPSKSYFFLKGNPLAQFKVYKMTMTATFDDKANLWTAGYSLPLVQTASRYVR